jgi:alpha-beta hydrolase superfamily lysophospholipase
MNTALKICLYVAVGYGLLVLLVFLLQRKMIYFPDRQRPSANAIRAMGLRYWPDDSEAYKGFVSARTSDNLRGTVIAFHGNAGSAWHRDYFIHALQPLGYQVILAEYPGYSGRPGKINETVLVQDAVATIKQAQEAFGAPIYLLGESMGCGVAAAAAASPDISSAGLILITPWDSLPDLAQTLYGYLPARMLTRDRFDSLSNLQSYDHPVAVAIAQHDEVVPNKHSLRLYHALTAPKRLWQFQGAGHNSWPTQAKAPWWHEAMDFVTSVER